MCARCGKLGKRDNFFHNIFSTIKFWHAQGGMSILANCGSWFIDVKCKLLLWLLMANIPNLLLLSYIYLHQNTTNTIETSAITAAKYMGKVLILPTYLNIQLSIVYSSSESTQKRAKIWWWSHQYFSNYR